MLSPACLVVVGVSFMSIFRLVDAQQPHPAPPLESYGFDNAAVVAMPVASDFALAGGYGQLSLPLNGGQLGVGNSIANDGRFFTGQDGPGEDDPRLMASSETSSESSQQFTEASAEETTPQTTTATPTTPSTTNWAASTTTTKQGTAAVSNIPGDFWKAPGGSNVKILRCDGEEFAVPNNETNSVACCGNRAFRIKLAVCINKRVMSYSDAIRVLGTPRRIVTSVIRKKPVAVVSKLQSTTPTTAGFSRITTKMTPLTGVDWNLLEKLCYFKSNSSNGFQKPDSLLAGSNNQPHLMVTATTTTTTTKPGQQRQSAGRNGEKTGARRLGNWKSPDQAGNGRRLTPEQRLEMARRYAEIQRRRQPFSEKPSAFKPSNNVRTLERKGQLDYVPAPSQPAGRMNSSSVRIYNFKGKFLAPLPAGAPSGHNKMAIKVNTKERQISVVTCRQKSYRIVEPVDSFVCCGEAMFAADKMPPCPHMVMSPRLLGVVSDNGNHQAGSSHVASNKLTRSSRIVRPRSGYEPPAGSKNAAFPPSRRAIPFTARVVTCGSAKNSDPITYNRDTHICCGENVYEKTVTQICCNGVHMTSPPDVPLGCCGSKPYELALFVCNRSTLFPKPT